MENDQLVDSAPLVGRPKPLFSRTLKIGYHYPGGKSSAKRNVFFLDVYTGRNGEPYLCVCENRMDGDGNFQRIRIYVSREGIAGMRDALDEINDFLESLP